MEKKQGFALILLASICVTYFGENFLKAAASALSPVLISELGINKGTMGLLITAFFIIYGIMQIPAGMFSDMWGPRKTILGFTALTIVGIFLFWISFRFEMLVVAQLIMGVGCSVFYINAVSLITHWFPIERKATAIGILSAASGLGNFTSYMGFPLANTMFGGWRNLYLVVALILLINFGMNIFILKDSPTAGKTEAKSSKNTLASFTEVLKDRRIYPFVVGYLLLSFGWVLNSWMTLFLMETKGLTYVEAGLITSVGTIAGIPGCITMGAISDRLRKRKLPLMIFSCLYTIIISSFIFSPAGLPVALYLALSFGINFCASMWVLFFSMVPEVLPPGKASIGLGLVNGLGTIGYSLITPFYGGLVDSTGGYFASNMVIIVISIIMTATMIFFTKETYGGINKTN
ncbi:MAG: MFS transporter [Candidatus Bathyarchaeota archaeon]|nr:MFS transporter [Candidatus Bathyarchaeota archaeon]